MQYRLARLQPLARIALLTRMRRGSISDGIARVKFRHVMEPCVVLSFDPIGSQQARSTHLLDRDGIDCGRVWMCGDRSGPRWHTPCARGANPPRMLDGSRHRAVGSGLGSPADYLLTSAWAHSDY